MLTTKTKVALAALAFRLVSACRRIAGLGNSLVVARNSIFYRLDLTEGIDFSIYLFGAFEPGTRKALIHLVREGDVVFDIGANVGAHTLTLAQCVGDSGKVYAFEPADFAFAKLKQNLELNPKLQPRVIADQVLLSARSSDAPEPEIYASWPLESNGDVHPKHRGRLVSANGSRVDTLDEIVQCRRISRLDLIKMDVDGHELPVLQGARRTIEEFRPTLVMELSPYVHAEHNHRFADTLELLKTWDYSLRDTDTHEAILLDSAELERLIPDGGSINVVATTRRRSERGTK